MDKRTNSNPFPLEVFPVRIQEIILELHESLGYPRDFIAAAILFAASVAIGNTHRVHVKEDFVESAVVYLAIVGRPGTNKTQPIKFALKPIRLKDRASYASYREQMEEYKRVASIPKKERALLGTEEPAVPVLPKTIMGDFTIEALIEVLHLNQRGLGVHADELASWFKNFTRYNQGSEMEFWLSAWSGTDVNKDRVSGDPTLVTMPFVSVIGSIQPAVLHELAKGSRSQNGFMDRMLFVAPDDLQKQAWSDTDLPDWVSKEWQRIMSNLLERELLLDSHGCPEPRVLRFTPEARKALFDWQNSITDICNATQDDLLTSVYSKLETYAARFALILQMLRYAAPEGDRDAVGVEAVKGAIRLAEYFKENALKVRQQASEPLPLAKLPANKRTLYDALPQCFSTSEALRIGKPQGMPERTIKHLLNDQGLFRRESHGQYRRLF
ncbi:YfjI family protein [Pontibacter cellulosilyticus]|uniref:DUF3987 domain-containing protein n=1 Tax=Pontibacter cellulosilyticus TaxID=1720253 RepID=A0A923N626_9BACT|nr:YfjI family protein [Pontibacter cellulosilyticus]MBC5992412.1 DUF3987 domain-containing protein [Pontibacter cellulosilyticus]